MHGSRGIRGRRHTFLGDGHALASRDGLGMMQKVPAGFALGCLAWQDQCPLLSKELIQKSNPRRPLVRTASAPSVNNGLQYSEASRPSSASQSPKSKNTTRPMSAPCYRQLSQSQSPKSKNATRPMTSPGCRNDLVDLENFGEDLPTTCQGKHRRDASSEKQRSNDPRRRSCSGINYLADRQKRGRSNSILMTKDLMNTLGFDLRFDMSLNHEASKSIHVQQDHSARLREMYKAGKLTMSENRLAELDAEVLSGLCTLFFNVKGGIVRTVHVEALRLVMDDGAGLMQVAKCPPGKGYKVAVGLPGGKRHANQNPNMFINELLNSKLQWLPSEQLRFGAVEKMSFTEISADFGIPTVYNKTVHHVHLEEGAQLVHGGVMRVNLHMPTNDACDLPTEARNVLREVPVFAILNYTLTEADVYGWLPSSWYESYDSPETKQVLKKWASSFKDEVQELLSRHAMIRQRGQRRKVLTFLDPVDPVE